VALSVEPYGIMLRKDDVSFKKVVNAAMTSLYKSGQINPIYEKWFLKPGTAERHHLNVPIERSVQAGDRQPHGFRGPCRI